MKYFNKPQINQEFCSIIRFIFRKTGKTLTPGNSIERKRTA